MSIIHSGSSAIAVSTLSVPTVNECVMSYPNQKTAVIHAPSARHFG